MIAKLNSSLKVLTLSTGFSTDRKPQGVNQPWTGIYPHLFLCGPGVHRFEVYLKRTWENRESVHSGICFGCGCVNVGINKLLHNH